MKITRVFFDVHMAMNFEGLREVAKKAKTKINEDSTIFFLNKKKTAFKVFRGQHYIVYYKHDKGQIPLEALLHLPESFGGSRAEMTQAITSMLCSKLNIQVP